MNRLHDLLSSDPAHRLGWTLIHSLWEGVLVGVVLRRFTRVRPLPAAGVAPSEPLDPELERQVDEELAR